MLAQKKTGKRTDGRVRLEPFVGKLLGHARDGIGVIVQGGNLLSSLRRLRRQYVLGIPPPRFPIYLDGSRITILEFL